MRGAAGLVALALTGCATLPARPALPPGSHYVALGSSYAAGAGLPPLATERPARCGSSQISYSRLLARHLALRLTDASCGGATTAHLLSAWNDLPAQVEGVTADTRLVTITVGGNDLNYMGLMFAASCHAGAAAPPPGGCAPLPVPTHSDFAALEAGLVQVIAAIRARAPEARIIFVQYVGLVADQPCAAAPLLPDHARSARNVAEQLARITAEAARRGGAEVLPIDRLSQDHLPCSAEPWSRGLTRGFDGSQGAAWHPTAAGHAAIAAALATLLEP